VQCDGKILFKEPDFLSLTKFKLFFQTEGKSINSYDVLKIIISVRAEGPLRLLAPGAENLATSLLPLHNNT
jgi:hypothetical protein